jgi:hypothetical protein
MVGWLVTRVWIAVLIMDGQDALQEASKRAATGSAGTPAA